MQLFVQDLVAVQGTNCWRYSDWGPLKHAEGYVSCSPVGQWTGEELNRWIGDRWVGVKVDRWTSGELDRWRVFRTI